MLFNMICAQGTSMIFKNIKTEGCQSKKQSVSEHSERSISKVSQKQAVRKPKAV